MRLSSGDIPDISLFVFLQGGMSLDSKLDPRIETHEVRLVQGGGMSLGNNSDMRFDF